MTYDPDAVRVAAARRRLEAELDGLGLFAPAPSNASHGLARATDPEPSHAAAAAVAPHLPRLRERVLAAIRQHGPITGGQLERLPELADLGFSSARKRAGELVEAKQVRGTVRPDSTTGRPVTWYEVAP